jgi:predicted RNase H-like HicB family nuclease
MERKFTLEYWIDDSWYVGRLKEVPGIVSQGETLEELEDNIADAYKMVISEESGYTPASNILYKEMTLKV